MTETPPRLFYQVLEAQLWEDSGLETRSLGVYPDEETAEREAERCREAQEEALEEFDQEDIPSLESWTITVDDLRLTDRQIEAASRMSADQYETLMSAASAVGYSLINE